jgi:hypothetical protein
MEDKKKPNLEKQGLARYVKDTYNREEYVLSHPGRTLEVLKHWEAAKRCHESSQSKYPCHTSEKEATTCRH